MFDLQSAGSTRDLYIYHCASPAPNDSRRSHRQRYVRADAGGAGKAEWPKWTGSSMCLKASFSPVKPSDNKGRRCELSMDHQGFERAPRPTWCSTAVKGGALMGDNVLKADVGETRCASTSATSAPTASLRFTSSAKFSTGCMRKAVSGGDGAYRQRADHAGSFGRGRRSSSSKIDVPGDYTSGGSQHLPGCQRRHRPSWWSAKGKENPEGVPLCEVTV